MEVLRCTLPHTLTSKLVFFNRWTKTVAWWGGGYLMPLRLVWLTVQLVTLNSWTACLGIASMQYCALLSTCQFLKLSIRGHCTVVHIQRIVWFHVKYRAVALGDIYTLLTQLGRRRVLLLSFCFCSFLVCGYTWVNAGCPGQSLPSFLSRPTLILLD